MQGQYGTKPGDPLQSGRLFSEKISGKDFCRLREFIEKECGIRMPESKKIMLEARLRRRLRSLGLSSFHEYCDFLFSAVGMESERTRMIDAVTTNKTEFFREPAHFEFLKRRALPEMVQKRGSGIGKKLMIWCAGCSTGEEAYTLAMILGDFGENVMSGNFDFFILASDISTAVLDVARIAVYEGKRIEFLPETLKKRYLMRNRDRSKGVVRIVPELRKKITFLGINLMEDDLGFREKMDIIFCRNVIIYFERSNQENVLNKLCRCLVPGGYLFLGHSETLHGLNVPLVAVAPTIFRYTGSPYNSGSSDIHHRY